MPCRTSWETANISQLIDRAINIFVYEAYEKKIHHITFKCIFQRIYTVIFWESTTDTKETPQS